MKKNIYRLGMFLSIIVASLIGQYGQKLAYIFYNSIGIPLIITILLCSVISMGLFILIPVATRKVWLKIGITLLERKIYIVFHILLASVVSLFTLLVLFVWMFK